MRVWGDDGGGRRTRAAEALGAQVPHSLINSGTPDGVSTYSLSDCIGVASPTSPDSSFPCPNGPSLIAPSSTLHSKIKRKENAIMTDDKTNNETPNLRG